jgi:hypothetical protein
MFNATYVKIGKGDKISLVVFTPKWDVQENGAGCVFDSQLPVEFRGKDKTVKCIDLTGMWLFEGDFAYIPWSKLNLYGYKPKKAIVPGVGKGACTFEAVVLKNDRPYIQNATMDGYVEGGILQHYVSTTFGHCGSAICMGDSVCAVHNRGRNQPGANEALCFTSNLLEFISGNV